MTGFTQADILTSNATIQNFAGSGGSYSFDLVATAQGLVSADIAADLAEDSGGNGNTAAPTFTRTYDVNDVPVASNGTLSTDEDTAASGTLSAADADGHALTFSIVTNGTKGTAVVTNAATGAFTYTPNANANGTDSFTFRASDGNAQSNVATIAITIAPIDDSPVAQNGSNSVFGGASVSGTLVATDIDSASLVYSIVTAPSKGTVVVTNAATGAYTYTAAVGANGTDTFTFKASDGSLDSNVATIVVTIVSNRPPVANPTTLTTQEDKSVSGTLSASDPDGDRLTFSIVANGSKGTVKITNASNGKVTYTPAPNTNGPDTFTFKVNDGINDSNVATVTVNIGPVNDAPVAASASYTMTRNTTLDAALSASDVDGDPLTYAIVKAPRRGTITNFDPATGAFTYRPATGFSGTDSFTFRVSDGTATSATVTVSIRVN